MEFTLLAPAGSPESFKAAIHSGANAVYLGVDMFNARRAAANFTTENLGDYIKYAHFYGVKVYVTLNILIKDDEIQSFFDTAKKVYLAGADALIIQDALLAKVIKNYLPDIELHLSTQAGLCSAEGAKLAAELGFAQAVIAREAPLCDIKEISKHIKTEAFIQGALCSSFSGHCYMSSFAGCNSGNRGLCKQPCRQKYTLNGVNCYAISPSDLSVGERIFDLIDAGVSAFKIEGRMRRPEYVAAAVKYYRDILDKKRADISPLKRTFNRGDYTLGLAFGQDKSFLSKKVQSHIGEYVGKIININSQEVIIDASKKLSVGSAMKILRNGYEIGSAIVNQYGKIVTKDKVQKGDEVRITTDTSITLPVQPKREVKIDGEIIANEEIVLSAQCGDKKAEIKAQPPQHAQNRPLTVQDIEEVFVKTDKYPFDVTIDIMTQNAFVPKSTLNELRRSLYEKLYNALTEQKDRQIGVLQLLKAEKQKETKSKIAVIDSQFDFDISNIDIAIYAPFDYNDEEGYKRFFDKCGDKERYLYLPPYMSISDEQLIEKHITGFDGIYAQNFAAPKLAHKMKVRYFAGTGGNITNALSVELSNADIVALSTELSIKEIIALKRKTSKELFVHCLGSLELMHFVYCPFGKNCKSCSVPNMTEIKDDKRKFMLRRIKLTACRFELYNDVPLVYEFSGSKIINVIGLSKDKKELMVKHHENTSLIKETLQGHTSGHSNRPVL